MASLSAVPSKMRSLVRTTDCFARWIRVVAAPLVLCSACAQMLVEPGIFGISVLTCYMMAWMFAGLLLAMAVVARIPSSPIRTVALITVIDSR